MKSTIIGIVVVVLAAAGWWYFTNRAPAPVAQAPVTNTATTPGQSAPMQVTVTYSANGFFPSTITVAKGGTVTFVNQSGQRMWVASDPHPNHQGYDGTTRAQHCAADYTGAKPFDQCSSTDSYSFTFGKSGSWSYHNHSNDNDVGTIVVQ